MTDYQARIRLLIRRHNEAAADLFELGIEIQETLEQGELSLLTLYGIDNTARSHARTMLLSNGERWPYMMYGWRLEKVVPFRPTKVAPIFLK